jgi:hypothetical protein
MKLNRQKSIGLSIELSFGLLKEEGYDNERDCQRCEIISGLHNPHLSTKPIHTSSSSLIMVIEMDVMIVGILIFWGLAFWILSGLKGWIRS